MKRNIYEGRLSNAGISRLKRKLKKASIETLKMTKIFFKFLKLILKLNWCHFHTVFIVLS